MLARTRLCVCVCLTAKICLNVSINENITKIERKKYNKLYKNIKFDNNPSEQNKFRRKYFINFTSLL